MKLGTRPAAYPNTNSHPTWSPDSRKVIVDMGSRTVEVDRENPDKLEVFSDRTTWVNYPDWSPQGDRIAFSAHAPKNEKESASWGIYTCDAEGENFHRILNDAKEGEWNPQGDKIAYQLMKKGSPDRLAVANADGSDSHPVGIGGLLQNDWSWDPQGHQLAYETYADGQFQIRVTDFTGKKDRMISNGLGGLYKDRTPEWSPRGDKIMFERHDRLVPRSDLWTIDARSGKQKQLTSFPGRVYDAAWSPDGSRIAFVSTMEGGDETDLYLMDADGKNVKQLSGLPGDEYAPSWSPDGTAIAFTRLDWSKRRDDEARYAVHIKELE